MKNELMNVSTVSELANNELKKRLNAILKELSKVNKSAWAIAHKYREIVDGEQYNDDFSSFSEFADFVGVKRTTLIIYSKVARLSNILKSEEYNINIETDITVSKVIELLPLFKNVDELDTDLIVGIFNGVIDEMGGFEVFKEMSNKAVRDYVKFYVSEHEEVEEAEEKTEVTEAEEAEEATEAEEVTEAEDTEEYKEVLISDYVLTAENVGDFNKTIANFIKQGITTFHITVRK